MVRGLDGKYRMDHAVTATQKDILRAFQMDANAVKAQADELSEMLAKYDRQTLEDQKYGKTARPRKNNLSIDEEIIKQEEQVAKSKAKYDADVKKLKDLYTKKDEIKKKELLAAVEKSSRTYEEIMSFLQGDTQL